MPGNITLDETFWVSLNWERTNVEIANELGHSSTYISQKRTLYGHRSFKHSRENWDGVDWDNKSNSVIARELGRTIQMVSAARRARGMPPFRRWGKGKYKVIDESKLAEIDWEWETDASIALKLGVSRERIRQIRIERKKPECKVKWSAAGTEIRKWLEEHRDEVTGMKGHEIVRMMPGECQIPTKYNILKKSGIKYTRGWGKTWKYGEEGERPLNWVLPTKWLALIWGMSTHQVSQHRMMINAGPSEWHGGGFSRYLDDPDFLALMEAEIQVATEKGIKVDTVAIAAEMERQKAAVARIKQKTIETRERKHQTKPNEL